MREQDARAHDLRRHESCYCRFFQVEAAESNICYLELATHGRAAPNDSQCRASRASFAMKKAAMCICMLVAGCFSVDLSSRAEFADIVGKDLTTKCVSMITPGTIMKNTGFGGNLNLLILSEDIA